MQLMAPLVHNGHNSRKAGPTSTMMILLIFAINIIVTLATANTIDSTTVVNDNVHVAVTASVDHPNCTSPDDTKPLTYPIDMGIHWQQSGEWWNALVHNITIANC
jgi:hypothetical protein